MDLGKVLWNGRYMTLFMRYWETKLNLVIKKYQWCESMLPVVLSSCWGELVLTHPPPSAPYVLPPGNGVKFFIPSPFHFYLRPNLNCNNASLLLWMWSSLLLKIRLFFFMGNLRTRIFRFWLLRKNLLILSTLNLTKNWNRVNSPPPFPP